MADEPEVRDLLERAARPPGGPLVAPMPELLVRAHRWHRRRQGQQVAAAVIAVMVALLVPLTLLGGGESPQRPLPAGPHPPAGAGTAQALADDHWTTLPEAPISPRNPAAVAWTGSDMLVWGGTSTNHFNGGQLYSDGAAYDPTTNEWTVLPAGPLSARADVASVWTGRAWFIWGGDIAGSNTSGDGALYDPSAGTWKSVPPAPLSARAAAVALWTGQQVIVLGGHALRNGTDSTFLDTAAYDPTTNQWTALSPLPLPAGETAEGVSAVTAGQDVYAWVPWSHIEQHGESVTGNANVAMFRLEPGGKGWSRVTGTGPAAAAYGVRDPQWTGQDVILPAAPAFRGAASGGAQLNLRGLRYDPSTGAWKRMPHGPVDDDYAQSIWTGAALLSFDSGTVTGGSGFASDAGAAAAWDPVSDEWVDVSHAPYAGAASAVWTGDALLTWGLMSPVSSPNAVQVRAVGLRLGSSADTQPMPSNRPTQGAHANCAVTAPIRMALPASTSVTADLVAGEPQRMTACRYGAGDRLIQSATLSGTALRDVVQALNNAPAPAKPVSDLPCPGAGSALDVVTFTYPDRPPAVLQANLDCYLVTNGVKTATLGDAYYLLASVVGDPHPLSTRAASSSCPSSAMRLTVGDRVSEATGQHTLALTLANVGRVSCTFDGTPAVALLDGHNQPLPFAYTDTADQMISGEPGAPVTVAPGGAAYLLVDKYRCDTGGTAATARVRLMFAGGQQAAVELRPGDMPMAYCGPGDPGSIVHVSAIAHDLSAAFAGHLRQPGGLVPADSQGPAAGACGTANGTVIVIGIYPDTPEPRCAQVRADQRLEVTNDTNKFGQAGNPITVTFADFPPRHLNVGQSTLFDRPFGDYLETGDHIVHVDGAAGAEVWFKP